MVVIGDLAVLQNAARILKLIRFSRSIRYRRLPGICHKCPGFKNSLSQQYKLGAAQPLCGKASYLYIQKAIDLAIDKQVDGVITNPINKESLRMAVIKFPGHTEIFAQRTNSSDYSMLFLLRNVGVAHVTTHCSLREAIGLISKQRVLKNIHLLNRAMKGLGVSVPRIAVAGLNPHAGENGLFGDEEIIQISPAIQQASKEGIVVSGPYPPDTVFMRAFRGEFDGIVSMLHDHGFVALKSMDFEHGVNITIGLPIIRTSVGHGTAYDLAGKGLASEESLKAALRAASLLCKNRREKQ